MSNDLEANETAKRGRAAHRAGGLAEAEQLYRSALERMPGHIEATHFLAALLIQRGLFGEAEKCLARGIAKHPREAPLHFLQGLALFEQQRLAEAIRSFDAAIALDARNFSALISRGDALKRLGRGLDAIASYDRAIQIDPRSAEAFNARGIAQRDLRRLPDAIASFDAAIRLKPDYFEALVHLGNIHLLGLRNPAKAIAHYDKAIALQPDSAGALYNRGTALKELKRPVEALRDYERAMALDPGLPHLEGARLHAKMQMCDWRDFGEDSTRLLAHVADGARAATPFVILPIASTPEHQRICAGLYAKNKFPPAPTPLWRGERYDHDKIRIAYLSGAYAEHPVALALGSVFESHDRSRFETVGMSFSKDDGGPTRRRLAAAFDKFTDLSQLDDATAAQRIRDLEVDIAIDLDGFTDMSRTDILARRPAPIQVNYLGFPATMGAPYIDYILADPTVIPQPERYAERVVWMPETFFPAETRPPPGPPPLRADCGLPEKGFVFCAFNNNYKITPDIFEIWMRLLAAVPDSVLWIRQMNPAVEANLVREAKARGAAQERLVFAPMVNARADHIARQQLADIFLDTLYYNAHSTAADALWSGVPLVTCPGPAFAGRVAASLLQAAGLSDLVTNSLEDYEALALKLARDADFLAATKAKLIRSRETAPLFDTTRFTRHLERAYEIMWERRQRGEKPASFAVG